MALTLNDEQERALREWFHLSHTSPSQWHPHDPGAGLRLAQAIAPLMKPWRVEYGTFTDTADGRSQSPARFQQRTRPPHLRPSQRIGGPQWAVSGGAMTQRVSDEDIHAWLIGAATPTHPRPISFKDALLDLRDCRADLAAMRVERDALRRELDGWEQDAKNLSRSRLRADNDRLREALQEIVDELRTESHPMWLRYVLEASGEQKARWIAALAVHEQRQGNGLEEPGASPGQSSAPETPVQIGQPSTLPPSAPSREDLLARPRIVCLCGSGRFREAFEQAEYDETLAGRIVLTIGCNTKDIARTAELAHHKPALDELHLRKIDLADEVLVLNVGGYIGESTRREIAYATAHGKPVRYLERERTPEVGT